MTSPGLVGMNVSFTRIGSYGSLKMARKISLVFSMGQNIHSTSSDNSAGIRSYCCSSRRERNKVTRAASRSIHLVAKLVSLRSRLKFCFLVCLFRAPHNLLVMDREKPRPPSLITSRIHSKGVCLTVASTVQGSESPDSESLGSESLDSESLSSKSLGSESLVSSLS